MTIKSTISSSSTEITLFQRFGGLSSARVDCRDDWQAGSAPHRGIDADGQLAQGLREAWTQRSCWGGCLVRERVVGGLLQAFAKYQVDEIEIEVTHHWCT